MYGTRGGASIYVRDGSPAISNNTINYPIGDDSGIAIYGGSPIIKDNRICGIKVYGGSPLILSNNIRRGGDSAITINGGNSLILSNVIVPGTYEEVGGSGF